uniref:LITAF domain-containing protein n=1 Tax=Ascaris lumbricoides TaxID=6252 RepID=A0A0M3HSL7_ASCLU
MNEAKKNELIPLPPISFEPSPSAPPPSYDDVANANKLPPINPYEPQRLAPINRATDKVTPQALISSTEPAPLAVTTPPVHIQPPTQLVILNDAKGVTQCPRCQVTNRF